MTSALSTVTYFLPEETAAHCQRRVSQNVTFVSTDLFDSYRLADGNIFTAKMLPSVPPVRRSVRNVASKLF